MLSGGPVQPLPLEYAPAPGRRRRIIRLAIFATILLAFALALYLKGPAMWKRVQLGYWRWQCERYTAPAQLVVYEEEPAAAKALLGRPGYRDNQQKGRVTDLYAVLYRPKAFERYLDVLNVSPRVDWAAGPLAVAFLGELESASGLRRLVLVTYDPWIINFFITQPIYPAPQPDPMTHVAMERVLPPLLRSQIPSRHTRIFAGQRDPDDPSRFTIRYQMWGQEDIIDGRMDDKGMVTLTARNLPRMPVSEATQP